MTPPPGVLYTIGHSTRALEDFLALLEREGIGCIVDVRRFPMSRRHPQYNREALAASLKARGIEYAHEDALGGRRENGERLAPTGWRVAAFNAYAHHMASPQFEDALGRVLRLAAGRRTAVMCAEAVPWRCHRTLISDAAMARGWEVRHILDAGTNVHSLTSFARIEDGRIVYGPARQTQGSLFEETTDPPRRRRSGKNTRSAR